MTGGLERRVRRLERGTSLELPYGKPPSEWTDEQLVAVLGLDSMPPDQYLLEMSTPNALIFGVREKTLAEWVKENPPPGGE